LILSQNDETTKTNDVSCPYSPWQTQRQTLNHLHLHPQGTLIEVEAEDREVNGVLTNLHMWTAIVEEEAEEEAEEEEAAVAVDSEGEAEETDAGTLKAGTKTAEGDLKLHLQNRQIDERNHPTAFLRVKAPPVIA
jgi:hypothetical protein